MKTFGLNEISNDNASSTNNISSMAMAFQETPTLNSGSLMFSILPTNPQSPNLETVPVPLSSPQTFNTLSSTANSHPFVHSDPFSNPPSSADVFQVRTGSDTNDDSFGTFGTFNNNRTMIQHGNSYIDYDSSFMKQNISPQDTLMKATSGATSNQNQNQAMDPFGML